MDIILPFMLDNGFSRGAFISADKTVADVLACHSYPKVVENVLGEAILLALALAGNIKFNGIFSFNVRGDGAVKRLFVSVTNDKKVRAYADFDAEHLPTAESPTNQELFGKGELLFSVAQLGQEPYQGIVQLTQTSLKETVSDYFRLSEQIKTDLVLRVKEGRYRCLVLQEMPHKDDLSATECADLWETQTVLLESVQDSELFDDSLLDFGLDWEEIIILMLSVMILIAVSFLQEKGICIKKRIQNQPPVVRWIIYGAAVISIVVFGSYGVGFNSQDFIYGGF